MKANRRRREDIARKAEKSTASLTDVVSLEAVKAIAMKLPETNMARQMILKMDDFLPRWIALGQLLLINKFLY